MAKDEDLIKSHRLVPKHTKLSEKATKEILNQYNIVKSQLPRIRLTDPAVKAIGAKVADIIEITRLSPTKGTAKYYRVVIDA